MLDPHAAFSSLLASGPRPRLTWSGGGEQLELSGRVCATWAAKVANLLVEEIDAGPDTRVHLDLPPHWRTVVWALGAWLTGSCLVLPDDGTDATPGPDGERRPIASGPLDVVVTSRPGPWEETWAAGRTRPELAVAVPLPSFALRWPGDLASGWLDGAVDVAAQPDALGPVAAFLPDAVALAGAGWHAPFADVTRAARVTPVAEVLALAAGASADVRGPR